LPAGESKSKPADGTKGFVWDSPVREDCPFQKSTSLTGIYFTGRHSDYRCGDTWYPCWASDGNLYSPPVVGQRIFTLGESLVLAPGRQFAQVAHNCLDKGSGVSPAPAGKYLLLRGGEELYCIGAP